MFAVLTYDLILRGVGENDQTRRNGEPLDARVAAIISSLT